ECHAVRRQGQPCPACGWLPRPRAERFEVKAGDLARVDHHTGAQHRVSGDPKIFHRMMLGIAEEKGRSRGWAWHATREGFGGSLRPNRRAKAMPPAPAARRWVLSRDIAYARAKARAAG